MRFVLLWGIVLLALTGQAEALETIRSSHGATAEVAARAAPSFRCLIRGLEATGYQIDCMGGYRRHGSVPHSLHPLGLALDINQVGRGRVTRRLPRSATSIAAGCGLLHGAVWKNQDQGHFQVMGVVTRLARRRTRRGPSRKTSRSITSRAQASSFFSWH